MYLSKRMAEALVMKRLRAMGLTSTGRMGSVRVTVDGTVSIMRWRIETQVSRKVAGSLRLSMVALLSEAKKQRTGEH